HGHGLDDCRRLYDEGWSQRMGWFRGRPGPGKGTRGCRTVEPDGRRRRPGRPIRSRGGQEDRGTVRGYSPNGQDSLQEVPSSERRGGEVLQPVRLVDLSV